MLKAGVRPIWKLVKSCLKDRKCSEAVENGQAALEKLQEERSERATSETAASKKAKSDVASDTDSGRGKKERTQEKQKGRLYPSLSELKESDSSVSSSSETGPDPETPDTETETDEEDRETLRKTLKRMKISKKKGNGGKNKTSKGMCRTVTPSALPPYPEVIVTEGGISFNPKVWRDVRTKMITQGGARMMAAFPVFQDQQGNRYHELLDFKTVKNLAESVQTYDITASFTDDSKTGCGAYMVDSTELVKYQFSPGAPQQVELAIMVEVFKSCPFTFNLILDSCYVVNTLKYLECAGPIKSSSPVHRLFTQVQLLLWQCKNPFFVQHIRAHTGLPGPLASGNDKVDQCTRPEWMFLASALQRAHDFHKEFHVNAKTLQQKFAISHANACKVVVDCPQCVKLWGSIRVDCSPLNFGRWTLPISLSLAR